MNEERSRTASLGTKLLAIVILAVAAWIVLKVIIGLIAGVAWAIAAVILVVAVLWALRQF